MNAAAGPAVKAAVKPLLAFDTSTAVLAVAVGSACGDHAENLVGGAAASAALLPAVRQVLARAGCTIGDIGAVAFGRGPGAFTGLRTSCAVAQGLALGLGCPVLPIDSLLIVAEDARLQAGGGDGFEVGVAVDARMGEVYGGRYRYAGAAWSVLEAAALSTAALLAERWAAAPPARLAGAPWAAEGLLPGTPRCTSERDRAAALLSLACQAWQQGAAVDAAQALPLYVRDKVAQTSEERAAAARAPRRAEPVS